MTHLSERHVRSDWNAEVQLTLAFLGFAAVGILLYLAIARYHLRGEQLLEAGLYLTVEVDRHVRALYCHLSAAMVADAGQVVTGEVIGKVGATGLATGAHLHFEVQVDGRAVDPVAWLS